MEGDVFCGVFCSPSDTLPPSPNLLWGDQPDEPATMSADPEWEPDSSRDECGRCGASFGLLRRRHHCRGCGVLLCHGCCLYSELPEEFGYGAVAQRVCRWCVEVKFNLLQAARAGHAPRVRVLMDWGIDTCEAASNGSTALHAAAGDRSHQGVGAVRCLTEQGFLEDCHDPNGWQPLHVASSVGNIDGIRVLLHAGAQVNQKTTDDGSTPLHLAIREGHVHTAQYLINTGACVNLRDETGNSPLLLAVSASLLPLVTFLVHHGADICAVNKQGLDVHAINDQVSPGRVLECRRSSRSEAPTLHEAIRAALSPRQISAANLRDQFNSSPTGTMLGRCSTEQGGRHVKLGTPGGTFRESVYFDPESSTASLYRVHHGSSHSSMSSPDASLRSSCGTGSVSSAILPSEMLKLFENRPKGSQNSAPTAGRPEPVRPSTPWRALHSFDSSLQEHMLERDWKLAELTHDGRQSDLVLGQPGVAVE